MYSRAEYEFQLNKARQALSAAQSIADFRSWEGAVEDLDQIQVEVNRLMNDSLKAVSSR